jgi:hypothetical protein
VYWVGGWALKRVEKLLHRRQFALDGAHFAERFGEKFSHGLRSIGWKDGMVIVVQEGEHLGSEAEQGP